MKQINREFTEGQGYKKAQLIYVLWVLENCTDQNHTLTQAEIADKVKELRGEKFDEELDVNSKKDQKRNETRAVGRALRILKEVGYNIHGVNMTGDNDYIVQETRGHIWLEKEISDEKLQMLIDTVLFANYIDKAEAKALIDSLVALGGPTIQAKKKANARIDGGKVYHREEQGFFNELRKINESMELKEPKRISFKYAKYTYDSGKDKFVLEKISDHEVSPYHFIVQKGHYYLVGYNHKKDCLWHYRLDYVQDVKILKENIKERSETELKGKDIGKYVLEHPYMFAGTPEGIEVRINADRIGILFDTFGKEFRRIGDNGDTIDFALSCTEEDAFHWAMQYGSYVEVLKPQSLRNRIRCHVESMVFNYQRGDGDKYDEAIRSAKRTKILNLSGIDLTGKTQHWGLRTIHTVYLSNNKIDNVDFLKNYKYLRRVALEKNTFKNLEFLLDKNLQFLRLDLGKDTNLSWLGKLDRHVNLEVSEDCQYNDTIPWDEIEKNNVRFSIYDRKSDLPDKNVRDFINNYYPFNFTRDVLGRSNIKTVEVDVIKGEVDKIIDKFSGKEKRLLELMYKEKIMADNILRRKLDVSKTEFNALYETTLNKVRHPSTIGKLEKMFEEENPDANYTVADVKKDIEKIKKFDENN